MDVPPGSAPSPAPPEAGPGLDQRAELSEFLRSRRARLKPEDVGLPSYGRARRVPGLRREELAQLAGVSVAYYTRLEQGNGRNVSAEVLDSIARALRLTDAERA
ncbi:helix-turn-helix domain-containing protein, partial [Streptomyces sp. TRM76130]|nr:helix-turn-helix domain-containing protein [Streptomyces sp. TRM76130]